ncbi:MAG: Gfo/Idh/MocA family oxidoreductase [Pseudomonadota bacterium]
MGLKLKVACIGAGYFSRFHLGSWKRIAAVQVVGVADMRIEAARETGFPAYEDVAAMLQDTAPDIVDIITPPDVQAEMIRMVLRAGVRNIICQKPFCRSLEEAQGIVREAREAGATLVVHENFRFMPWYRRIKAELHGGKIGRLHQATFRLRPGDGQGPDAYLDRQPYFRQMQRFLVEETAVHWIDTFRFLFGPPISVYADLRQLNPVIAGEDAGYILFDFGGGVRAMLDGNRHLDHASDNQRRTMGEGLFEGSEGVLSLFGDGRVEHRAFGSQENNVILAPDNRDGFGGDCVHALQCHVLAAIRDQTKPENTAAEYCSVLRIRDAIYESAERGQKVYL